MGREVAMNFWAVGAGVSGSGVSWGITFSSFAMAYVIGRMGRCPGSSVSGFTYVEFPAVSKKDHPMRDIAPVSTQAIFLV